MKNLETEFKWTAHAPQAFLKMICAAKKAVGKDNVGPRTVLHLRDIYLDHSDGEFEKEKIAFRVRRVRNQWEATFKTRTELVRGKAVRREETQALGGVKNLQQALVILNRQKSWKGISLVGLRPRFSIYNTRAVRQIVTPQVRAELSFDTCRICAGGRQVFLKEIELEYLVVYHQINIDQYLTLNL